MKNITLINIINIHIIKRDKIDCLSIEILDICGYGSFFGIQIIKNEFVLSLLFFTLEFRRNYSLIFSFFGKKIYKKYYENIF